MLKIPEYSSDSGLTDEHCEALSEVDLRLSFGIHGWQTAVESHGFAVLAIQDSDFHNAHRFVNDLDATQGDVFAQEGSGHSNLWSAGRLLGGYAYMLTDSPYVNSDDHSLLRKFLQDDTVAAAQPDTALERFAREDPAIIALWDKLRAFQLTSPIEYAAAKAACKGVEIHYADASAEESHVADNAFYKRISGYGTAVQLAYEYRAEEAVMKFRDIRTLRALGNIATTMSAINETAPVLAYMGGIAHRKNIERVLNQHDIKFKSETFSPDRDQRNRRQNLRSLGHLATASWKTGIVDDPGKYYDKLWIANAQAQSAA